MKNEQFTASFRDYITVREAANILGVSPATLRNWDRAGKLKAKRHPINGYRLYDYSELYNLLSKVTRKDACPSKLRQGFAMTEETKNVS